MKKRLLVILVLVTLVAAGCAAGPNPMADVPNEEGDLAGFWTGLWQGIIAPIAFIVSLFSDNVHMYEVHNNGGWYNLGFAIGAGILLGGGGRASRRSKKE